MKYYFHETFTVDFTVEADSEEKANRLYSKLFDRNINLGYSDWKGIEDKDFPNGKFYVWSREDTETPKLIKESFFGNEEEE